MAQLILQVSGKSTRSQPWNDDPNVRTCAGGWCACAAGDMVNVARARMFWKSQMGLAGMCFDVGDKLAHHMPSVVCKESAGSVEA